MSKEKIVQGFLTGERALYMKRDMEIYDTIFTDGESPLKECENIDIYDSMFQWKYPLWYCKHIHVNQCTWWDMARAGVWYTDDISVVDALIEAPKNFRRCDGVTLKNVQFTNAQETFWHCKNVEMEQVTAKGDYFAMNCENLKLNDFKLVGNYSFDGVKNMEIHRATLLSRDAFWNTENVTVYDSMISGEYLGWNSKNLTLVNCTVESLQGMCYINNLRMINCKLLNTTLAFEYSTVEADISSGIRSVMNPSGGTITAESIGELILDKDKINPDLTKITVRGAQ